MGGMFLLLQADTQYKVLEGEYTLHCQIQSVSSKHRTNLKGVNFGSSVSNMRKLCVTGSPVVYGYKLNDSTHRLTVTHTVTIMLF